MQLDRRNIQLHDPQVLHDQGIHAGVVQLVDQLARRFQFVVVQDGVERGEHPRVIAASEGHQLGDVAQLVAGVVTRAEAGPADVDGVGAMQDGLAGDGNVACGAEQFEVVLGQGHVFLV
ncbi:hypothetical protein ABMD26_004168 [Pseudomonas sp. PvP001]